MINEKTLVSTVSLATSLLSYFYAKETSKDVVPYVMIGGFIGAILGEAISGMVQEERKKKECRKEDKKNEADKKEPEKEENDSAE